MNMGIARIALGVLPHGGGIAPRSSSRLTEFRKTFRTSVFRFAQKRRACTGKKHFLLNGISHLEVTALPPDVRRRLCPGKLQEPVGLCPWFGLGPSSEVILPLRTPVIYRSRLAISPLIGLYAHLYAKGQSPNQGRSPSVMRANRRGKAGASHRAAKPCRCLSDFYCAGIKWEQAVAKEKAEYSVKPCFK